MSVLNRAEILDAMKLKSEEVPLGKDVVLVSEIGASDYIKLWTDPLNQIEDKATGKSVVDMSRFTPALMVYSVTDEVGNRIFTDEDIPLLARGAQGPFLKIAEVARRLNGLSGEEVKNSVDSLSESSSSASV